jgi:hypothetical protein
MEGTTEACRAKHISQVDVGYNAQGGQQDGESSWLGGVEDGNRSLRCLQDDYNRTTRKRRRVSRKWSLLAASSSAAHE